MSKQPFLTQTFSGDLSQRTNLLKDCSLKYDIFISHSSQDKDAIARPLAQALHNRGLQVWLDEDQLKIGDSIRRGIDSALNASRFGVVILSPAYLDSEWGQKELDAFFTKEKYQSKSIFPIYHGIEVEDVERHWPMLADKISLNTQASIEQLADNIQRSVQHRPQKPVHLGCFKKKSVWLTSKNNKQWLIGLIIVLAIIVISIGFGILADKNNTVSKVTNSISPVTNGECSPNIVVTGLTEDVTVNCPQGKNRDKIEESWLIINQSAGKPSGSTKIKALEYLVSQGEHLVNIDLSNSYLEKINLSSADLRKSTFDNTNLDGANLSNSDFSGSKFSNLDLYKTNIHGSNFTGVRFSDVNIMKKNLSNIKFNKNEFYHTNLQEVKFENSNLENIFFKFSEMHKISFNNSNLNKVYFSGFSFKGNTRDFEASFENSSLENSSFDMSSSLKINFRNATLKNVVFDVLSLRNSDFRGATIKNCSFWSFSIFEGAIFSPNADLSWLPAKHRNKVVFQ